MTKQQYTSKLTGEVLPFQTRSSYVNDKAEKNDKPSDTDATLFVPLKTMINKIVQGDISAISDAYYDSEHEDPTDAPGYDIADAFEDIQKAQDIIDEQSNKGKEAKNSPKAPETQVSEPSDGNRSSAE